VAREAGVLDRYRIDSAGTAAWHVGKAPDERACLAGAQRGYDLSALRARQVSGSDFEDFDLILAMDRSNMRDLQAICPAESTYKLKLFLDFAEKSDLDEVPDPYYGGAEGFNEVFDLAEAASRGLLAHLQRR
jgi:protein-tyrosine phosphatase